MNPHSRRRWLFKLIPKKAIGAEVGVWKGNFSSQLLKLANPKELHLIDPWIINNATDSPLWGKRSLLKQEDLDNIYLQVCDRFKNNDNIMIHRTLDGLSKFKDDYFDWVYIDGDHSYDAVLKDLTDAMRVVKPGGLIIGDDFSSGGWWKDSVILAVAKFGSRLQKVQRNQYVIVK